MEKYALENMMEFGEKFVMKRVADVPEAQINLVCLAPQQALPAHNANSNVRLLSLLGEITLTLSGETTTLSQHEMITVAYNTPMQIRNTSDTNAAFLVIKTPNPSEMGG